jgi:hypothetical protein
LPGAGQQRADRVASSLDLGQQQVAVGQQRLELLVVVGEPARDLLGRPEQLGQLCVAGGDGA